MQIPRQSDNSKQPEPNAVTPTSLVRGAAGPRTRQGKERTKYNALKQGIFSKLGVLEGESRAEFDALWNGLRDDFRPEGTFEEIWVEKLATLLWRERRLIIADGRLDIRSKTGFLEIDGLMLTPPLELDLLIRYDTTLSRNIDRILNQLERHQRMRRGEPVAPPINVSVSSS